MPSLASISDYRAYHILSYGTFLGSTIFQSFVGGVVAYKCLPRPMFSRLQESTFPVFFTMQSILPIMMMLTFPGETAMQLGGERVATNSGISGLLTESNRWSALVPMATIFVSSVLNLLIVGPATTRTMKKRHHQETRDGKKSYDEGPHSSDMQKLNKQFAQLHGASSLLNLSGLFAAIYYSFALAERL